jgi:hypothetical protein
MTTTNANAPAVWVLIFDRITSNPETEGVTPVASDIVEDVPAIAETGDSVFDRLDAEATNFEQFILQDVRHDRETVAFFGGEPLFQNLAESMRKAGQSASLVELHVGNATISKSSSNNGDMASVMQQCRVPLNVVTDVDCRDPYNADSTTTEMRDIDRAFLTSLVWMEAHSSKTGNPVTATSEILGFVLKKLQSHTANSGACPWLIVTFRHGLDGKVREPFMSGLAEDRIHVPLWIRGNTQHACRVQALAGSFDLLPTITEFLGGTNEPQSSSVPSEIQHDHKVEALDDNVPALSPEPRSLAFLCGAPQICTDRLLKLRGDGWIAARTGEFLLVIADDSDLPSNETESDGDNSEESSRRLYAKPEDRFNVNDVSGTYVTAADALARLIQ